MDLPDPITTPLAPQTEGLGRLRRRTRRLAESLAGEEDVLVLLRTRSRIDVGGWFGRRRVWVAALADSLVLFAPGRRPCRARIPFAQLRESAYNPVTGELALAPAEAAPVRALRVSPLDGYQLLAQFRCEDASHAPTAL